MFFKEHASFLDTSTHLKRRILNNEVFINSLSEAYSYALLFFTLYEVTNDNQYYVKCKKIIDDISVQAITNTPLDSITLAGITSLLRHLGSAKPVILNQLEEKLLNIAFDFINSKQIGLINGIQGILNYFTQNQTVEIRYQFFLTEIIQKLQWIIKNDDLGSRIVYNKNTDLTMPWGLTGLLYSLMRVYHFSTDNFIVGNIIDNSLKYILNYKSDVDFSNHSFDFFPNQVDDCNVLFFQIICL
ncbi:MAG: lanthionine synthetase LanC family protein [Arcicella sp.]|nr:lanthionine synthetase LanC family protein [Arcicella sp.]